MGGGVGQGADGLQQLEDRPRPAVGHDQRHGVRMAGANVDEVNVQAVDVGQELREGIEFRFRLAPVVASLPVPHQRLKLVELYTLGPVGNRFPIRPACSGQTAAKIVERGLRNTGAEGANRISSRRRCRIGLDRRHCRTEHREGREGCPLQEQGPAGQDGECDRVLGDHGRASFHLGG
ncbi:hypothetical protein D9M69_536630 [compost metagenome]